MAVGVEYADDRLTLYQYIVKGKISFNTIDGNNFTRETSGVSFTFNTTGGTIEPASFANASNAAQNVT